MPKVQRQLAAQAPREALLEIPEPAHRPPPRPAAASASPWLLDVLVVDDDIADTWLTVSVLRTDPRVRCARGANSPDEMLQLLAGGEVQPDLILLDIKMPRVDGFRFIDALREIPALAGTPVVMLTTSRHTGDREAARQRRVHSYVVKPDSGEKLREALAEIITEILGE